MASARSFAASQSVVQIYGTCDECRTGRQSSHDDGHKDLLFARDALRIAIATERSGLQFYSRAARITRDPRGRKVFEDLAEEEKEHLGKLEARYGELLQRDPQLESRPTFLFFKGAANGLFAEGTDRLARGVNDQQALLIGIRVRAGFPQVLQEVRRALRGLGGQADLPGICRRGAAAPRAADPRVPRAGEAARPGAARFQAGLIRSARRPVTGSPGSVGTPRVDLHLHTTASDGRCTPRELVERAARASLNVIAVTDHDTTAAVDELQGLAARSGIQGIAGIEITAVDNGRDVHVLGYFIDPADDTLQSFLSSQRAARASRLGAIAQRLAALGMPIDLAPIVAEAERDRGRSVGRPLIARAMVSAGYVADTREAFENWLVPGRPAFVPRPGAPPEAVVELIHHAGGIASLAHPGKHGLAARVPSLALAGLDAVETFHPDHDAAMVEEYAQIARDLKLLVTGGSDFHGDPAHGLEPGSITLPAAEWVRLQARHDSR